LIQTGIIERPAEGCLCCGSHRTSRRLFDEIDGSGRVVVGDLEAGVMDLLWVWPKAEDTVLVVTEPYLKSLEVARRAVAVTREFGVEQIFVVGNRLASAEDAARVRSFFSDYPVLEVPDDPAVIDAARLGLSPMDTDASCPAVLAIGRVADELSAERPAQARST
jgi:CO dehydrogenase nickel-insertion accessory protein CooC1